LVGDDFLLSEPLEPLEPLELLELLRPCRGDVGKFIIPLEKLLETYDGKVRLHQPRPPSSIAWWSYRIG
jgi:hypothetical protein